MPIDSLTLDTVSSLAKSLESNFSTTTLKKLLVQQIAAAEPGVKTAKLETEELIVLVARLKKEITKSDENIDESSQSAKRFVEEHVTILESERLRLAPIAAREHWVALGFAIVSGAIFFLSIFLATVATSQQAVITLIASLVPGFLSAVFFSREATIEKRLKEISADLWASEQMREKLALLREALPLVHKDNKAALAEKYILKTF
jgi:hypothetical protein